MQTFNYYRTKLYLRITYGSEEDIQEAGKNHEDESKRTLIATFLAEAAKRNDSIKFSRKR